jgi:Divergent InlB B-repeat domain
VSPASPIIQITGTANTTYTIQPEFTYQTPPTPTPSDWTLTVSTSGSGSVSPSVGSHVVTSLSQTLIAYGGSGYEFKRWLIDGASVETANPYTLTAAYGSLHTVVAVFEPASTPVPVLNQQSSEFLDKVMAELEHAPQIDLDVIMDNL